VVVTVADQLQLVVLELQTQAAVAVAEILMVA
jgi:hypothetical protein